ncbi:RNA polymerase sigma factor [soil metagenome]
MVVSVLASSAGEPDDAELVARVGQRDPSAMRLLVRRYNRRLYRIARGVVRDSFEAEDVVQQAYVQAFTHIGDFRGEAQLSTWLSRIVLNEALGRLRRRRLTVALQPGEGHSRDAEIIRFPGAAPDPERMLAQHEISAMMERAIDDLPDDFRLVLVARVVEEMSLQETADLLGIKPETVKTRLHRARRLIKAALERELGPALLSAFPFDGWRCERMADAVMARLGLAS